MSWKSLAVLLFVITVTVTGKSKGKDDNTECDQAIPAPVLNRTYGDLDLKLSIDQLAGKTCEWVIDATNQTGQLNIHLDFVEDLVLGDNDSLKITTDNNKTSLYETKGFQWPGVVVLGDSNKRIRVKLTLSDDKISRNFDVKYGTNQSSVQLQNIESTGKFVFPLNNDANLKNDFTIILKTKMSSKKLLLNLETLDLNGAFVNFSNVVKYNDTLYNKPVPDFLLTNEQQINIKLTNLKNFTKDTKGLQLHYDLVDAVCTQYKPLTDLDKDKNTVDVLLPKTEDLKSLTSYRCLNIFEHSVDATAKLLLDLRSFKFLNNEDLISVLDGNSRNSTTVASIDSQFIDTYWRDQYLFCSANKMWVMYESPQVINRVADPSNTFGVLAVSQGGSYMFNTSVTNTTKVDITSKKDSIPVVFTFTTDSDQQIAIDFDKTKKLPGPIDIYDSDSKDGRPFISLNSDQYPPDIMASNGMQLKAVFNQTNDFKLSLSVVSLKRGCHSTYMGTSGSSFSLSGCSGICSWLIPKKANSNGTFVFQFSHLNLPKDSDNLLLETVATQTSVFTFKGPLTTNTFPDLILDSNETYVLYAKRTCDNSSVDGSELVGVSLNYLDHDLGTHEEAVDNNQTIKLSTLNYPNYYSVGSDHLWQIANKTPGMSALLTFTDIDLSPDHQLLLRSKGFNAAVNTTLDLSDSFVNLPLFVNLTSDLIDSSKQPFSGRGFTATLSTVSCGESVVVESGKEAPISTPTNLTGISKCIWTVFTKNPNDKEMSVIQFKSKDDKPLDLKNLRIWDTNSIRNNITVNYENFNTSTTHSGSSSTNSIVIEYTITDPKTATPLSLVLTQAACKRKCDSNKRCFLPEFYCNGRNDCGDYTDELGNCSSPFDPNPPPAPIVYHSGVNGWVVLLVICPLMIGFGVLGTLFGPRLMSRVGRGRYREFQDFSEVS